MWPVFRRYDRTIALAALGLAFCAALASFGYWYFAAPNRLTIAAGPPDSLEARLVGAYSEALAEQNKDIRLRVRTTRDLAESAELLQQNRVDLAVIRPDILLPSNARTVAILRIDAVVFLAPSADKPDDIGKLARKRLGVLSRDESDAMILQTLLDHYNLAANEIALVPLAVEDVDAAIAGRRIDALVFFAPAVSSEATEIARTAARAWNGRLMVVPVSQAEVLETRNPLFAAETIAAGSILGRPALPAEEIKTIGVSYRLVARPEVDRTIISRTAQYLFQMRTRIAPAAPGIHMMKAPDTDTSTTAALPNHLGANDYFHREQRTFMDDYGDWIWIALFAVGGLSSGLVWVRQLFRRTRRELVDKIIDRLLVIVNEIREAKDRKQLDKLSVEIDGAVAHAIRYARRRMTSTQAMSSMMLAIDTARAALAERRRELRETERFQDATLDPSRASASAAMVNAAEGKD